LTLVIAHRGASAYEPENSLAAFRAAKDLGADAVELDVQTTADGAFVIHHDAHIGATTIPLSSFYQVRSHSLANGESVPTLEKALAVLTGLVVFVEVKTLPPERDEDLFAVLAAGPTPDRYHVHGFDHRLVQRLQRQRPSLVYGALSSSYPVDPLRQLADAGASELWQGEDLVDAELVERAHQHEYRVYAWTVDNPLRMEVLAKLNVDGICTNVPDVARAVVDRR
jgi:glycerophosphoryl diester phosphodiesterase